MKPSNAKQTLGQVLDAARQHAGYSLRQLETITGIHRSSIDRLLKDEVDEPTPDNLIWLADALELNAADLFVLAGLPIPTELPSLEPYLRTKYDLPPEALAEAQASIRDIVARYKKESNNEQ